MNREMLAWFGMEPNPGIEVMLAAAVAFMQEVREAKREIELGKDVRKRVGLILVGPSGCGKTHVAGRVWEWWTTKGRYYTHPQCGALLSMTGRWVDWRKAMSRCAQGEWEWIDRAAHETMVVVDDMYPTAQRWSEDVMMRLLDARTDRYARGVRATLVTINSDMGVPSWDPRIKDRLFRLATPVVVNAKSYAMKRVVN